MELRLGVKLIEKAIEETKNPELIAARDVTRRLGQRGMSIVDGSKLDIKTLRFLYQETKEMDTASSNSIEFLYRALKKPSSIKIHNTSELYQGFVTYLKSAGIKNYVFERGPHKALLPYVVTKVDKPNLQYYGHERKLNIVDITLAYDDSGTLENENIRFDVHTLKRVFELHDIPYEEKEVTVKKGTDDEYTYLSEVTSEDGVSIEKLLAYRDKYLETAELHELLDKQTERYLTFIKMYGQQFHVRGTGSSSSSSGWSWYSPANQTMTVEGNPGTCIMNTVPPSLVKGDSDDEQTSRRSAFGNRRRSSRRVSSEEEDSKLPSNPSEIKELFENYEPSADRQRVPTFMTGKKEGEEVEAPLHPELRIYHLNKMENYTVHVNNLRPYKYKEEMSDNLIMEEDTKDLIKMLVANAADQSEDVIEGKTQSTVIAAVGDPGLGKTLMCEVMSEACRKPLYKVQAAQLGRDPEQLEETLQRILLQAQRWDAILMIDEANAYIHSRGHDISQNAIVGVFLRLLDYYRGILVLTTNMTSQDESKGLDFDIDAAILNRCKAVIRFKLPDDKMAKKLWKLQAKLHDIKLDDELLNELVTKYQLAGRTIRNLLSMASSWAAFKNEELSFEHFKSVQKHVPLSMQEQKSAIQRNK